MMHLPLRRGSVRSRHTKAPRIAHPTRSDRRHCWRWQAGLQPERVYKVKEGRPNVVDLIKGDRIHLIVNTPRGQDTFFDEQAIRRAAVLARIPTITTLAAARAAAEGISALQQGTLSVVALQTLHSDRVEATV